MMIDTYLCDYFHRDIDFDGKRYVSYDGQLELIFLEKLIEIHINGATRYATSYRLNYDDDATRMVFKFGSEVVGIAVIV